MLTIKVTLKGVILMPHYHSRRTTPLEAVDFLFSFLSFITGFAFLAILAVELPRANQLSLYRIGFIATL